MTQLSLSQVTDTDCLKSQSPLVFGRRPGIYVTGAAAVMRRVLYAWALPRGVLSYDKTFGEGLSLLEGKALAPRDILALQHRLTIAAGAEDFVSSASVTVAFAAGVLTITASITLVDGVTYPLELSIDSVGAALSALGV
jgi:hypothetical protein